MKLEIRAQTNSVNNRKDTNTSASTTSNNQRPHMVIPYTKGLSESLKNVCSKHRIQLFFRGGTTIRNLPVALKDKDPITKKRVELFIEINVTGWSVMKNILESPQEHLGRGSKNT